MEKIHWKGQGNLSVRKYVNHANTEADPGFPAGAATS